MTNQINRLGECSKKAFVKLSSSKINKRNNAILNISNLLKKNVSKIIEANQIDLEKATRKKLSDSFIDRLLLNESRIIDLSNSLIEIVKLEDPVGKTLEKWERPNGLEITRVSVPLGVIGIIYESRPNVTIDAGCLCIKSGNVAILRGGSDSFETSKLLTHIIQKGLIEANLPQNSVQFVNTTNRDMVTQMITCNKYIDLIIPRGGKSLISKIQNEAKIPVFSHLDGICHIYVDHEADEDIAEKIILNSKLRRVGICGAAETLLIDKKINDKIQSRFIKKLLQNGCEVRGDQEIYNKFENITLASDEDWSTEYLDLIISVKLVDGVKEAVKHIYKYSSNHTETIITKNDNTANYFLENIDSSIVMHNASTQFADGGEFGMGAEIGISTGKFHARGPVGINQLTSFKYIVRGSGQVRK